MSSCAGGELATQRLSPENETLAKALAIGQRPPAFQVVKDLQPLPPVAIDQEQIPQSRHHLSVECQRNHARKGAIRLGNRRDGWNRVLTSPTRVAAMSPDF